MYRVGPRAEVGRGRRGFISIESRQAGASFREVSVARPRVEATTWPGWEVCVRVAHVRTRFPNPGYTIALSGWNAATTHSATPPTRNAIHIGDQHHACKNLHRRCNHLHLRCAASTLNRRCASLPPDMTPFSNSPLLFLLLIASASAKTTISFYQNTSCAADSPSAGDAFNNDNLATGSGICYKSPANTVTLKIEEIDEGCSGKSPIQCSLPSYHETPTL